MLKKIVSVFTLAAFLVTGVMSDFAYARSVAFVPMPLQPIEDIQPLIPSSLGKITSSQIFDDDNIIINIQDLHCHAQTQKKIASIIEYFDAKYGLDKVYLEGAFNVVDTTWLSELNNNKIGAKIVENLLNTGRLSGTEYYSTIKNKKNFITGIENEKLYKGNIELLGKIIELSPEIEAVCKKLETEITSVRKEYASPTARKLQKLISYYDNNKIKTKEFYAELKKIANELNVALNEYKNLFLYISLTDKTKNINNSKISSEFARFIAELKNKLNYKDYSELLNRSNKFTDIENIYLDLIKLNNNFGITKSLKLKNIDEFFASLEVNGKINPMELIKEKEEFINELYIKAGRTKYEKEVSFLAEFVTVIKKYFTAEISADEYYNFEESYNRFKTSWISYLPSDTVKKLDDYYDLLSRYHRNNILRDQIFFSVILSDSEGSIRSRTSIHPALHTSDFFSSAKKITLVVTGGFHTRGLEKIFQNRKVSYAIITPKVTEPVEQARQLYTDNILYYSTILENTMNIEPLTQEPLNVSFRKVMEGFFNVVQSDALKNYSEQDLQREIYKVIQEKIIDKQNMFYGNVEILDWKILSSEVKTGDVKFVVKYRDNGNNGIESSINYIYSDGKIQTEKEKNETVIRKEINAEKTSSNSPTQALVIFKNLFKNSNDKIKFIYSVLIAPVIEEIIFRAAPFILTTAVLNGTLTVPAIITIFTGTILFPLAHILSDKITKTEIRDWKNFILPSIFLTGIYLVGTLIFPQYKLIVLIIPVMLHSINNIINLISKKNRLLSIIDAWNSQYKSIDEKDNGYLYNLLVKASEFLENNIILIQEQYREQVYVIRQKIGEDSYKINKEDCKILVENIKILLENPTVDYKIKRKIIQIFVNMAASELYVSLQEYNFFDIDRLNKLCREYKISYYLKPVKKVWIDFSSAANDTVVSTKGEYSFINLLKYLPEKFYGKIKKVTQEPPILYMTAATTDGTNDIINNIRNKFSILQNILNCNIIVLSLLDGLSTSKTQEKDMQELINVLINMINSLTKINDKHGKQARFALFSILMDLYEYEDFNIDTNFNFTGINLKKNAIKKQMVLDGWTKETISSIKSIHTLINAVHQQSISDFKGCIEDVAGIGYNVIKTIVASHRNTYYKGINSINNRVDDDTLECTGIRVYDLSEKEISSEILDLIGRISQTKLPDLVKYPSRNKNPFLDYNKKQIEADSYEKELFEPKYQIDDFLCIDNFLVWTIKLYKHSVDIFINFAESDKTITIAYHEGGRDKGNSERVRYFAAILENLGFSVEADTRISLNENDGVCGLKADLSVNQGLNENADFIDIVIKIVSLFKYSNNFDIYLKNISEESSVEEYNIIFQALIDKFMIGDIWYEYSVLVENDKKKEILTHIPERKSISSDTYDSLKEILEYLGLQDNLPKNTSDYKINQNDIDKYFNEVIERSFAVGRIIVDDNGKLSRNKNYDVVSYLAQVIPQDEYDAVNKSSLINTISRNKFKFKIAGYVGKFIAVSGYMKLKNGDYLSVKGLVEPANKMMQYCVVEYVSASGRKNLNTDELENIFAEEGFDVSKQEGVSKKELEIKSSSLHRKVQVVDTSEIRGVPISQGNGTYVAGRITFDKNKVNENSIWIVPYTTPDDVETIKTAKGILTTGGGVLSHAAITSREYKTPSVVINGTNMSTDGLNVLYCSPVGGAFEIGDLSVRIIEGIDGVLKEGSVVLINGETGHILLFDDVEADLLDLLQSAIESDSADLMKEILVSHADSKDIRKLTEYVYFQAMGDTRTTKVLEVLFSSDMPEVIKEKVTELNAEYVQDKIIKMKDAINNLKTTDNPNIAYSIVRALIDNLRFIKTPGYGEEFEMIKKEVDEVSNSVKNILAVFMEDLLKRCRDLNKKTEFTSEELTIIINIIQQANVYEMFVADNEPRQDLQNLKADLEEVLRGLDKKLKDSASVRQEGQRKKYMLKLEDIQESDVFIFGSKTTEIARIHRLLKGKENVTVPDGIGISYNAFERFFDITDYKEIFMVILLSFEDAVKNGEFTLAKEFAGLIKNLLESSKTKIKETESFRKELEEIVLQTLGDTKYSVRSSGVGEDSANNAFAGMGETMLNVRPENLFDNLLKCWQSFYSDRSIKYMINSQQPVRPAVLIQPMIDVDKSGVAFSRDKAGNATIETLYGQGEAIVSGKFTPDTITVNMRTGEVSEYSVATKDYKIIPVEEGTKTVVSKTGAKERTLNYEEIKSFVEILRILEEDASYAVDVEFGFKDGTIYILQRRPITTNNIDKEDAIDEDSDSRNIKCRISVVSGTVPEGATPLVYIVNPLDFTTNIPVYLQYRSVKGKRVTFVVDEKFDFLAKNNILEILLLNRIKTDYVVRKKFNGGVFNFLPEEIGLLETVSSFDVDTSSLDSIAEFTFEDIRDMLSAS